MGSDKTKTIIMAVVFLLVLGAVVAFVFLSKKPDAMQTAGGTNTPGMMPKGPGAQGMPGTTGAPVQGGAPAVSPLPAHVEPTPAQLTLSIPAIAKDPLGGGPKPKPPPPPPPPPPAEVKVFEIPPVSPTPDRIRRGGSNFVSGGNVPGNNGSGTERTKQAPLGRHAGWVYNTNGQIWAIFEDSDGTARAVRVGDEVGGYTVKAIAQDYIILTDAEGKDQKIKLQGLDTFQGKTRNVTIDATPGNNGGGNAPPPPAWGAP